MIKISDNQAWALQKRTVAVWIILSGLTVLDIYLVYGKLVFDKWPAFRFSIVMSTFTCLWTYVFWFFHLVGNEAVSPMIFAVLVLPLDVFLMHPGGERLGLTSGDNKITTLLLSLAALHGLGFYMVHKGIRRVVEGERPGP